MSDDGFRFVLVLVDELLRSGEGYLVDVLVHLLGGHTDTAVADGECLFLLVDDDLHAQVSEVALHFPYGGECLEFLRGVHRIADELAQEDFVIRIQEFLYHRKDVVRCYSDGSF